MEHLRKSLLIGAAVAALAFLVYEFVFLKKARALYDIHYTAEIIPGTEQPGVKDAMAQIPFALKRRLNKMGYEASVTRKSEKTLDILVKNAERDSTLRHAITDNSKLELYEMYELKELLPAFLALEDARKALYTPPAKPADTKLNDTLSKLSPQLPSIYWLIDYPVNAAGVPSEASAMIGRIIEKDTALLTEVFSKPGIRELFPNDVVFCYGARAVRDSILELYAIKTYMRDAEIQNRDIKSAEATFSYDGQYPELRFELNGPGAKKWEMMTTRCVKKCIAILVDGKIISAPRVNEPISGGSSSISGGLSSDETQFLANQLSSGLLPARLLVLEENAVRQGSGHKIMTKLLITLLAFIIAAGTSLFIFKMLKNN